MSEENMSQSGASGEAAPVANPNPAVSASGVSGTPAPIPSVDPLALGRTFKKIGEFVVDANFDPTLTPEYKALNNALVAKSQEADSKLQEMSTSVTDLKTKLSEKEGMVASEKEALESKLGTMQTAIEVAQKDALASRVDLLKIQTASANGLPYSHVKYVTGTTPAEIEQSVKDVLADFDVASKKFTKDEMTEAARVAADNARAETETALKNRGVATENGKPGEHIFTRLEIAAMDLNAYKANRSTIEDQQKRGLIK